MHSAGRRNRTGARSPLTPPSRLGRAPFSPPLQCGEGGGQAGGRPAERSASASRQCRHRPRRARHRVTKGQCSEIFVKELIMDGLKLFSNEHDSTWRGTNIGICLALLPHAPLSRHRTILCLLLSSLPCPPSPRPSPLPLPPSPSALPLSRGSGLRRGAGKRALHSGRRAEHRRRHRTGKEGAERGGERTEELERERGGKWGGRLPPRRPGKSGLQQ